MRGTEQKQPLLFYVSSLEEWVRADHPLRRIRTMVDEALGSLSEQFDEMYSERGRPSIAPERLLRAVILQMLFSIPSERQLVEDVHNNLLYRWFVGLELDDPVWDRATFSKNRQRLLEADVAREFFAQVIRQARRGQLLSNDHFTVDGTLIEAWASHKSFQPKSGKPPEGPEIGGFKGEKRSNETHASTTDPDARLYRKSSGEGARLAYLGHVLTENGHGLIVDVRLTRADGYAERAAAVDMVAARPSRTRITLGADKGYDTADLVHQLRQHNVTPHVAQHTNQRASRIDARTTRHPGYQTSQRRRPLIERVFSWIKGVAMLKKTRHRGTPRVGWTFTLAAAVYNLVRMRRLLPATA
jgi:transposase